MTGPSATSAWVDRVERARGRQPLLAAMRSGLRGELNRIVIRFSATSYGVDAVFIALEHSIPTLNGYSAWNPDGWSLSDPPHPWYPAAVRAWVEANHLDGVCQLDIDARRMTPYVPG